VQSAVSRQIASLERIVGVRLVDRTRGHPRVALTPAGRLFGAHARDILVRLDAARADLRSVDGGPLRLGVSRSVPAALLGATLARLEGVPVTMVDSLADRELYARVAAGELDVGCAELPLDGGPLRHRTLAVDPVVLLVPAGHALAGSAPPPALADIGELDLIANAGWRMLGLIEDQLAAAGFRDRVACRAGSDATVQALVAAGLGAALVPRLAVDDRDPGVAIVDLDGLLPARRLVAVWHAERRHGSVFESVLAAAEAAGAAVLSAG
jgi:DNA-binding transcriptional LysR family regulator